jgi:N-acetylglucosaminyldiphosphoundecaprenol N-acetyl-beta-D-mannosaminyltransferase
MAPVLSPPNQQQAAFVCCGVRIDPMGPAQAAAAVRDLADARRSAAVHLCNANNLSVAMRDESYRELLNDSTYNFADGFPVAWAGRRAGHEVMDERVYGPTLMIDVMRLGVEAGLRHYLYGSTPEVVEALAANLTEQIPGLQIAGIESPPFGDVAPEQQRELADRLRAADAHIVWVGISSPRQDRFCREAAPVLGMPLLAVGAAFDFHAGTKPMAPAFLQDHGLEWAFRLATEPRRLWRRYLVGNTVFLAGLARDAAAGPRPLVPTQRTGGAAQPPVAVNQKG